MLIILTSSIFGSATARASASRIRPLRAAPGFPRAAFCDGLSNGATVVVARRSLFVLLLHKAASHIRHGVSGRGVGSSISSSGSSNARSTIVLVSQVASFFRRSRALCLLSTPRSAVGKAMNVCQSCVWSTVSALTKMRPVPMELLGSDPRSRPSRERARCLRNSEWCVVEVAARMIRRR
jgi:hypothetical protein